MEDKEKTTLRGFKVYLNPTTDEQFRKAAMTEYGYAKGSLSLAAEEALSHWAKEILMASEHKVKIENPVETIRGLLEGKTSLSSVELQHMRRTIHSEKYLKGKRE